MIETDPTPDTATNPTHNDNTPAPAGPPDDLLWQHLKALPAFRALLRAVEARFYHLLELPEPLLDLGCGDGDFAARALPGRTLTAGIDPWWNPLKKSQKAGIYEVLVQGMGDAMPFPDEYFATIFSNSVLEHIPDLQPVLQESNRVLRPGGRLILTTPSHYFTEWLGGARYFGDGYRRFFNRISRHAHTDPPEQWAERLALAGYRIVRWQYYFSPQALHALEIGHVQGLPSAILHFLTGHWILAPWEESLRRTERWLRPFYEEEAGDSGAYMLIVAEKVSTGPIPAELPPPRPFTRAELESVDRRQPTPVPIYPAAPHEEDAGRDARAPYIVDHDDTPYTTDSNIRTLTDRDAPATLSPPHPLI